MLRAVTACGGAFGGGRLLGIITTFSCREKSCNGGTVMTAKFPRSLARSFSVNTTIGPRGPADKHKVASLISFLKHTGCGLVGGCLFATSFHQSNSDGFTPNGG